jgi:resuscitation-promoting factor RpfA
MNLRPGGLVVLDLAVLRFAQPDLSSLRQVVRSPADWITAHGIDGSALLLGTTALWLVAAWLAVGLLAATMSALPGVIGRRARATAGVVLPQALQRLAFSAAGLGAGLGMALSPAAAFASTMPSPAPPSSTQSAAPAAQSALSAPGWPQSTQAATPPVPIESRHAVPRRARTNEPAQAIAQVIVQPGDSLWSIAKSHLPAGASDADIAATWPAWYSANKRAIGDDPSTIDIGTRLQAPPTNGSTR